MKPPISGFYDPASTLEQRATHEVSLYDPAAHDDQIVAMFETPAAAQAAVEALRAEHIAADARVTDRTENGANAGVNSEGGNTGLLGALKGLFAPDDEVHGLAEGVRRGHALLVVHPALEHRSRVIQVLEASGPIDFDARLEQWRSAGWQALHDQQAASMGAQTTAPAGTQAPSASLARPRAGTRDPARGTPSVRSYYSVKL